MTSLLERFRLELAAQQAGLDILVDAQAAWIGGNSQDCYALQIAEEQVDIIAHAVAPIAICNADRPFQRFEIEFDAQDMVFHLESSPNVKN